MKTEKRSLLLIIFILLFINSCTKDSNPVNGDSGEVPPPFSNLWHDINVPAHEFFLQQIDVGVTHGLFSGNETWPDSNIFQAQIVGEFTNKDISFYSIRSFGEYVKFSGKITTDTTMDLTSSGRKITIKKGS